MLRILKILGRDAPSESPSRPCHRRGGAADPSLTAPYHDLKDLLRELFISRGDSPQAINKRLLVVRRDEAGADKLRNRRVLKIAVDHPRIGVVEYHSNCSPRSLR